MKLVWLIPDDLGGGIVSVALSACRQAARDGHDVTLMMIVAPSGWIEDATIKIVSFDLYESAPQTPRVVAEWIKDNAPDVLLLNGCKEADAVIPYLPANVKCVYVVHDTAPIYWQTAVEREDDLDAVVAVSETVAVKFRHRLKDENKLKVIWNGSVFPPLPATWREPRANNLTFLGAESPTKGAFDVLDLWAELARRNFVCELHWFGHISESFVKKIKDLPHAERIIRHGRVQRSRIFEAAANAKVLLMLSRVEPFGMATIEAMSMGCVPVAWDIETGTKEIVAANRTGFLAPLGDVKNLADQVIEVCTNHASLIDETVTRARSDFDETVMWSKYRELLRQLCAMPPHVRSRADMEVALFEPPLQRIQLLPPSVRRVMRNIIGRSPRLNYWLRDLRGR